MKKQLLIDCKFFSCFSWYDFSEHCFLLGIYVFLKILFPQDINFASVDCFFFVEKFITECSLKSQSKLVCVIPQVCYNVLS